MSVPNNDIISNNSFTATRILFEKKLYNELEDMDDPLELFIEYIHWLHNSSNNPHQDIDLKNIIERCLNYFKEIETYNNDPRYLKIWLLYIVTFYSMDLNECLKLFVFMFNFNIGTKLTLFFEEFSKLLFNIKRYNDSFCILQIGLQNNARPYKRLLETSKELTENLNHLNFFNVPNIISLEFMENIGDPLFILEKRLNSNENNIKKQHIFNDNYSSEETITQHTRKPINESVYKIIEIEGRKPEKIDCNFNLIYNNNTKEEFNFDQLLALSRKFYNKLKITDDQKEIKSIKQKQKIYSDTENFNALPNKKQKLTVLSEKGVLQTTIPSSQLLTSTQNNSTQEYTNRTKTSILPLKDGEKENNTKKHAPNSPTVTMFSRDAMSDVYSMFNQNYEDNNTTNTGTQFTNTFSEASDNTTNRFTGFEADGFTQDLTRQNIDDLTEVKTSNSQTMAKNKEDNVDNENTEEINRQYKSSLAEFMTPIQEKIENYSYHTQSHSIHHAADIKSTQSSPFLTQPQDENNDVSVKNNLIIEHPLDISLRSKLLATIQPPLDEYKTFYRYNQPLKMSTLLKKIHKVSLAENKNPIVDFKKTGDLYCIRAELGQGGYAIVYLAESSAGHVNALKIEKPASVWEYYILKQIESRLSNSEILKSIIQVDSLHYFLDESYLVLNYANQGTVLDLINSMDGQPVDELLCMFISIELMKIIEKIHQVGIIHGDLKPDNCMIRFESCTNLGPYNSQSLDGWDSKGIFLIDFGRSFDLTLFPPGTRFKSDWKTDQQDCSQMRLGQPWTFEADYYGLAGIIHSLLFGKFIDTIRLPNNQYRLRNTFKRYWEKNIWENVFDTLLNSSNEKFGPLPIIPRIRTLRGSLEKYLDYENNSDKLRRIILDLEIELTMKNKTKTNDLKNKKR